MPRKTDRVPLRLPGDLRRRLNEEAAIAAATATRGALRKASRNAIIVEALWKELKFRASSRTSPTDLSGEDLLAYRCLSATPVPIVIKNANRAILYGNPAYLALIGASQRTLHLRTIEELGLLSAWELDAVIADMTTVLKSGKSLSCLEFVSVASSRLAQSRVKLPFITHRFRFEVASEQYLGDVSFDCTQMIDGANPAVSDPRQRSWLDEILPGVEKLLLEYFRRCPTAMAIKDREGRLLLYNWEFAALAGKLSDRRPLDCLKGRTAQSIWGLAATNPVSANDRLVIRDSVWMYAMEALNDQVGPRVSLRFPILGADGRSDYSAVISTTAGIERYQPTFFFKQTGRRK
jgi:hypothetical protein